MKNLTEAQAHAIAREGAAVRRAGHRHWFMWTENQLVLWIPPTANAPAVEQVAMSADFTLNEWESNDWTDEPWPLSEAEGGGAAPLPPGANPPSSGGSGTGSGGGSGGSGGSGSGGSGGGGGGGGSGSNPPGPGGGGKGRKLRGGPSNASVSVSIAFLASPIEYYEVGRNVTIDHDDGDSCFIRNLAYVSDVARVNLYLTVTVAGLPASGGASVGVLDVRIAGQLSDEGFMNVGNGQRTVRFSNFTFVPGGTITATASVRNAGQTFHAASVNKMFDPWCAAVPDEPPALIATFTGLTEVDPSNHITGASPNGPHTVPWVSAGFWQTTFASGAFDNGVTTQNPIQWYLEILKTGDNYTITMYPDIGPGRGGFLTAGPGAAFGGTHTNTLGGGYFESGTATLALP